MILRSKVLGRIEYSHSFAAEEAFRSNLPSLEQLATIYAERVLAGSMVVTPEGALLILSYPKQRALML